MTMMNGVIGSLVGLALVAVPSIGRAQIVDKFNGPKIDRTIWRGGEAQGDDGTENTETSRSITQDPITGNGRLQMSLTSFGKTDSDLSNGGFGTTRVRLLDPAGLTQLSAQVTVAKATAQKCPTNTDTGTRPRARISGAFFNDGLSSKPGDETGDVIAHFSMVLDSLQVSPIDPSQGHTIELSVSRCKDAQCNTSETPGFTPAGGFVRFKALWQMGHKRKLTLLWDQANHQFVATVDAGTPHEEVQTVQYGALSDVDPPGFDFKDLRVTTAEANCTGGVKMSQMTALFDNFSAE